VRSLEVKPNFIGLIYLILNDIENIAEGFGYIPQLLRGCLRQGIRQVVSGIRVHAVLPTFSRMNCAC
jgi:hypothetical protein